MRAVSILTRAALAWAVVSILYYPVGGTAARAAAPRGPAPIVYAAIGDSLTAGDGADDPETQSYPAVLARHLPRGARFLNFGGSGASLDTDRTYELPGALAAHATLVTIWVGANVYDYKLVTPETVRAAAAYYRAGLDPMLASLQRRHVRVFVANEPHVLIAYSLTSAADRADARIINQAIAAVAARHGATVIDVDAATKVLWGNRDYTVDGVHLSTAGYRVLAGMFYRVMHSHHAI
jgi:acyl-CoA thioesterase I